MITFRSCLAVAASALCLVATPSKASITGYWSFEAADLFFSGILGGPLNALDQDTDINTQFGNTGVGDFAAVPNIGGQNVPVMLFPKTAAGGGYQVPTGVLPPNNGGGNNLNVYTIIADILFPPPQQNLWVSLGSGNRPRL